MILIPFIYFTLLTIYWWKKHQGFDVCVYMSGLYAFTAFCNTMAVPLGLLGEAGILFDEYDLELGIIPTFLYCTLLTLGMLPFSFLYNKEMKKMNPPSSLVLEGCCWFLFVVFLLNFYLVVDSTAEILSGDLSSVRADHYNGIESPAEVKAESLPYVIRLLSYFNAATILALPLFFYYSCFSEKPWWFKTMLFVTSLSKPLMGFQSADRTEFTFFSLMFIFCLIFFKAHLSKKFKRGLIIAGVPLLLLVLTYLVAVTQARFATDNDNDKATTSAIQYAGQNYLNFCFFWEHGKFEYIAPEREFPMTWHTLYDIDSNAERRSERSSQHGFFMSVFATYIGDVMLDLSPLGVIIWCSVFFLISICIIRYNHRQEYDVGDILMIFILAAIPIFGIFYYRYYSFQSFYMLIIAIAVYIVSKTKIIYK